MNVLVGCEFSGIVRDAFIRRGHFAISCDFRPSESDLGPHYQGDILDILNDPSFHWDLAILHPPCTRLSVSGARWKYDPRKPNWAKEQEEAVRFFMSMVNANIPKIAVENPISIMSTRYRKPNQTLQPWEFGHKEMKAVCLWLKGLPNLIPTDIVGPPPIDPEERKAWARVHRMAPGPEREREIAFLYRCGGGDGGSMGPIMAGRFLENNC